MSRLRKPPRWAVFSLGAYALALGLVLLSPVGYSGIVSVIGGFLRDALGLTGFGFGWIEFFANIAAFIPLGGLLTACFRGFWLGLAAAVLISVAAELVQGLIPMRVPSLRDVAANVVGALIGCVTARTLLACGRARARDASTTAAVADH